MKHYLWESRLKLSNVKCEKDVPIEFDETYCFGRKYNITRITKL